MSDNAIVSSSPLVRDVEVRTWPERPDLLVIDIQRTWVLAHYSLSDPEPELVVFDPSAPYQERLQQALSALEKDQDYLRAFYAVDDDQVVKLQPTQAVRQLLNQTLAQYGLDVEKISLPNLTKGLKAIAGLDFVNEFRLLCDWHDVVERHYPAASSISDPQSWVHRAAPEVACHFHYLATGLEFKEDATQEEEEEAYQLFRSLVDIPLQNFTFGHALRWSYFHRTEFPKREPFQLQALLELKQA